MQAYVAVNYLRYEDENACFTSIEASKTRVAPLPEQTNARLELLSALLLARLTNSVYESLKVSLQLEESICFPDSKLALRWIQRMTKDWKPFIQNRVEEIRRLISASQWKHCSGKCHPADLPSQRKSW
jgi:hypothetical protein